MPNPDTELPNNFQIIASIESEARALRLVGEDVHAAINDGRCQAAVQPFADFYLLTAKRLEHIALWGRTGETDNAQS